jgi:hypothetical protein
MSPAIPYKIIAECFRNHTIVPFLGSAASFVGAPGTRFPDAAGLAAMLAEQSEYPGSPKDPLTKIAQYLEEVPADRSFLLDVIGSKFFEMPTADYQTAATGFLRQLAPPIRPRLVLTTNYDTLVERTLEAVGHRYITISHVLKGSKYAGRLLCSESLGSDAEPMILTLRDLEERLIELDAQEPPYTVVYKMHGTALRYRGTATTDAQAESAIDSVVLTENDYIEFFAQDLFRRIPARIVEQLRVGRLLFVGYSLADWNFRVMLRKLQSIQRQQAGSLQRHWAFLLEPDDVEVRFWERRGVNVYSASLDTVLASLSDHLGERRV